MSWKEPLEWITTGQDGEFVVNQTAAKLIREINQPLTVVAVAGLYRTGKSYLMNRLAGKPGFDLGSTVQSKTKGIWLWCLPHPLKRNESLILIDTEGLRDPKKGGDQHDLAIFCLTVLLSSTFIFNAFGNIDQDMIDKLHFVTKLTERIKVKTSQVSSGEESSFTEFSQYFPDFILAVRDFTLELEMDGRKVTPDEYFEHILKLKGGRSKSINAYNLPREAIRGSFKSHKCFVFTRPVLDENLFPKLARNEIEDSKLSPAFLKQSENFRKFVLETSKVKELKQGIPVTGPVFVSITEEYVKAINSGAVPCIESTVTVVAQRENARLMEESFLIYQKNMQTLSLPTDSDVLDNAHAKAYEKASDHFRKNSVFDHNEEFLYPNEEFFDKLALKIRGGYAQKLSDNEKKSTEKCTAVINKLFEEAIGHKLQRNEYSRVGGYKQYREDLDKLLREYDAVSGKGVKADEVRNNFLKARTERQVIKDSDSQLREKEKEFERSEKKVDELQGRIKKLEELKKLEEFNKIVGIANGIAGIPGAIRGARSLFSFGEGLLQGASSNLGQNLQFVTESNLRPF